MGAQNSSLSWGGHFHQLDILNLSLISKNNEFLKHGKYNYELPTPLIPRSSFLMRSHVVDNKGCRGRDSNFSILGIWFLNNFIIYKGYYLILFIVPGDEKNDSRSQDTNYMVNIFINLLFFGLIELV